VRQQKGKKVYLAVTDALSEELLEQVKDFATARRANVLTISESDIKATAATLKQHMKIGVKQ
jgi:hypothetical protein